MMTLSHGDCVLDTTTEAWRLLAMVIVY